MKKCAATCVFSLNSPFFLLFFFFFLLLVLPQLHRKNAVGCEAAAVFGFGDSIFDAGNNNFLPNCTIRANFQPYGRDFFRRPTGRFTNGRTVVDFILEFMGLELQKPYLEVEMMARRGKEYPLNGINFASAGSGVLNDTGISFGVIPLETQLEQFEALVGDGKITKGGLEKSVFLFEAGSNDIIYKLMAAPKLSVDALVSSMVASMEGAIGRLHRLGAYRFAVFGLGPIGCIPIVGAASRSMCNEEMNMVAERFNLGLERLVLDIPSMYPGAAGIYGSTFELVQLFRRSPDEHGFVNVTSACCGVGVLRAEGQCGLGKYEVCDKPEEYLFWDYFHPSERTYKLIAKAFWSGGLSWVRPFNLKRLAYF